MFKKVDILDEKEPILRETAKEAEFPLSKKEKDLIQRSIDHLTYSQIEEYEKKYDLRPGMGLAFPQLGISKRIIIIVHEYDDGKFDNYVVINPKIVSNSSEIIATEAGEGCLSVNREVEGIVPRHARITVEAYDENGDLYDIRVREDMAVAFQHELDHLDGILFTDKIDPKNPYKNKDIYRAI